MIANIGSDENDDDDDDGGYDDDDDDDSDDDFDDDNNVDADNDDDIYDNDDDDDVLYRIARHRAHRRGHRSIRFRKSMIFIINRRIIQLFECL